MVLDRVQCVSSNVSTFDSRTFFPKVIIFGANSWPSYHNKQRRKALLLSQNLDFLWNLVFVLVQTIITIFVY